ncbi:MAG: DNA repair protein RecO [Patescibacteria group bacterium]|jgi:DNA repair protein RecO (recombination protein O)
MEPTFNTRAIILDKKDFREADSRIIVFSEDFGKMLLVVRGGKKIKSKLAGHSEPFTLSRLMVVRGKDFDYAGSVVGEEFYSAIKEDLDKIFIAGQAIMLVDKMTREGEVDGQKEIFNLLKEFLDELEKSSLQNSYVIPAEAGIQDFEVFSQKLTVILGFSQEDFEELRRK